MASKRKRTVAAGSSPPSRARRGASSTKASIPQRAGVPEPAKRRSSRITAISIQMTAPTANMRNNAAAALEAAHGDVLEGLWKRSLESPLMRLPRNVRDLIYAHLLTAPTGSSNHDAQSEVTSETASITDGSESAEEHEQVFRDGVLPGTAHGYPFIAQAVGLLCANKQLHSEASEYLYGKNTFVIMPEHTRAHCFWHCGNDTCREDIPCLAHLRNIKQIKHLAILVRNPYKFDDPSHDQGARCLQANLATVARCLNEAGIKLDTLEIRYLSCVNGRIADIRGKLDTMLRDGGKPPVVMLRVSGRDKKSVRVEPGPHKDYSMLFQNTRVLDELNKMAGTAKSVAVSGDLSTSHICQLTHALVPSQPVPISSLKRKIGGLPVTEGATERDGTHAPQKRKSALHGSHEDLQARPARKLSQKRKRTTDAEDHGLPAEQADMPPRKVLKLANKVATDLAAHRAAQTPQKMETTSRTEPAGYAPQYRHHGQPTSIYHQMPNMGSYTSHQEYCNQYSQYMSDMMERMQQTPIYASPEFMAQMWGGWNAGEFRSYDYYG